MDFFFHTQNMHTCLFFFSVLLITPHQSTGVGYNFVIMCTNITLTCTINFIGSAQTSPELWVFYWARTSATVLHIPVSAHAHVYNSGLVWALPIELMWQVSVIFVHMTTALYPTPMLWCGVIRKTVKNNYIFSCCWTAQNAQTLVHNSVTGGGMDLEPQNRHTTMWALCAP